VKGFCGDDFNGLDRLKQKGGNLDPDSRKEDFPFLKGINFRRAKTLTISSGGNAVG